MDINVVNVLETVIVQDSINNVQEVVAYLVEVLVQGIANAPAHRDVEVEDVRTDEMIVIL